jgi:tryptophan synthase alpha subunit
MAAGDADMAPVIDSPTVHTYTVDYLPRYTFFPCIVICSEIRKQRQGVPIVYFNYLLPGYQWGFSTRSGPLKRFFFTRSQSRRMCHAI